MASRNKVLLFSVILLLLTTFVKSKPAMEFDELEDVEMIPIDVQNSRQIADMAECPIQCTCSMGAVSDLVVQCREYQGVLENSMLPRLANQMEQFVTRLDIEDSNIPILIDDFLNNERAYSRSLRSLRLSNSGIAQISSTAFKTAKNLEEIDISNNALSRLPNEVFSSSLMPNLRMLSLKNNKQLNFPKHAPFIKSNTLEELDLSFCGVKSIRNHSFKKVPSLVYVNLANNLVTSIDPEAFTRLDHLEEVDLSGNNIVNIPSQLPPSLQILKLRNNPQFNIESLITLSPNVGITELDISQCNIQTLPRNVFNRLNDLTNLNLSSNALTNIYFPFTLRQLQYLDISHNKLNGILLPNLLGSSNKLETLRLGWNPGLRIPEEGFLGDLSTLYLLDISGCDLDTLVPTSIQRLTGLTHLNISNNRLETLSEDLFQPFSTLSVLDLSVNKLNNLPNSIFHSNKQLRALSLASNPHLAPILSSNALTYVDSLIYINIAGCDFIDIPERLPKGIETLIARNNKFNNPTKWRNSIENDLIYLKNIEITENPWKCNFEFKRLIALLRERHVIDTSYNDTWSEYQTDVCIANQIEETKFLLTKMARPLEVDKSHFWSILSFSATLMVFLVIAAGVTVISCKKRLPKHGKFSSNYRHLSESSNINNTPITSINNNIYNETTQPKTTKVDVDTLLPPAPTKFTSSCIYPRFPVDNSEISSISYASGNFHHNELEP